MRVLLLRFDAPLMSFGGPAVDSIRPTEPMPGRSMLTGLIANALGYTHAMADELGRLQSRIRYAVRRDRVGQPLRDYQTVDLGQPALTDGGWTTWGVVEKRGGANSEQTHIRHRHYHADAVFTLALTLDPAEEEPRLAAVESALREPARPLFLGRKACLPSTPILLGAAEAESLRSAVRDAPTLRQRRQESGEGSTGWWPTEEEPTATSRIVQVHDTREWKQGIHVGVRDMRHGELGPPQGSTEEASQ